jgi:lipoprotein-anchoring transpeptidase ErfK/SrfK
VAAALAAATAAAVLVSSAAPASGGKPAAKAPIARWSVVATLVKPAPKYATATAASANGTIPVTWRGAASVLPVLRSTPTRLLVRIAQRPNGQRAWIPAEDATLSRTPYEIVIHLRSTHLMLYRGGRRILSTPIGVGTRTNPTPTGAFFVAFFAMPPSSAYGPFVLVTSAHSNTITDWEQSGDAMIGIHGPLGKDAEIGTTGARISHGCVRLHVPALRRLRPVPAGSPVYIVP